MPDVTTLYTMMATRSLVELRDAFRRDLTATDGPDPFCQDRLKLIAAELTKRGHRDPDLLTEPA